MLKMTWKKPNNLIFLILFQYTHSGKKVEIAVKRILAGEDVTVRGAYSNPNSLDLYYNIELLQGY